MALEEKVKETEIGIESQQLMETPSKTCIHTYIYGNVFGDGAASKNKNNNNRVLVNKKIEYMIIIIKKKSYSNSDYFKHDLYKEVKERKK